MTAATRVAIFLIIAFAAALVVWGLSSAIDADRKHNAEQVAECKRLGGFARTNTDGWLETCTFPGGGR